jgi:hypothetical protein
MTEYTPGQAVEVRDGDNYVPGVYVGPMPDGTHIAAIKCGCDEVEIPVNRLEGDIRPARRSDEEIALEAVADWYDKSPVNSAHFTCCDQAPSFGCAGNCQECRAAGLHALILAAIREHEENKR